jgi:hypothetical protein
MEITLVMTNRIYHIVLLQNATGKEVLLLPNALSKIHIFSSALYIFFYAKLKNIPAKIVGGALVGAEFRGKVVWDISGIARLNQLE